MTSVALSSVPVAFAMSSRLSSLCWICLLPSAEFTCSTGAMAFSCVIASAGRSVVATMRSGASDAMVSTLGSPRVPMSAGSFTSGTADDQAL